MSILHRTRRKHELFKTLLKMITGLQARLLGETDDEDNIDKIAASVHLLTYLLCFTLTIFLRYKKECLVLALMIQKA